MSLLISLVLLVRVNVRTVRKQVCLY